MEAVVTGQRSWFYFQTLDNNLAFFGGFWSFKITQLNSQKWINKSPKL